MSDALPLPGPLTYRDGELNNADGRVVAVVMSAFSGFSLPTAHATGRRLALAYTVHDKVMAVLKVIAAMDGLPAFSAEDAALAVLAEVARLETGAADAQ